MMKKNPTLQEKIELMMQKDKLISP